MISLQFRVKPWLMKCFGEMIAADVDERNRRFLEEALELVQSCGCDRSEAHHLVDYVFDRLAGVKAQEVGGVMITLAALCIAQGLDMHECGETELARIWTKVEQIRAKQAVKPKHSPLQTSPVDEEEHGQEVSRVGERERAVVEAAPGKSEHVAVLRSDYDYLVAKLRAVSAVVEAARAWRKEWAKVDGEMTPIDAPLCAEIDALSRECVKENENEV